MMMMVVMMIASRLRMITRLLPPTIAASIAKITSSSFSTLMMVMVRVVCRLIWFHYIPVFGIHAIRNDDFTIVDHQRRFKLLKRIVRVHGVDQVFEV
uniref:Putative secreted protein n=1 Tax=Anopheles darlingi TaxID=43151 RepID=A0A2M4D8H6_ANODA